VSRRVELINERWRGLVAKSVAKRVMVSCGGDSCRRREGVVVESRVAVRALKSLEIVFGRTLCRSITSHSATIATKKCYLIPSRLRMRNPRVAAH